MAADSMTAARRTPLIAAFPKMFFPFLVILPGMIALAAGAGVMSNGASQKAAGDQVAAVQVAQGAQVKPVVGETANSLSAPPVGQGIIPPKEDAATGKVEVDSNGRPVLDYDLATPMMLLHYFPAGLLGLGLTALLASFMSGMAGNVTAFNTVWTYDLYQGYLRKGASDQHYLWMGRFATVFGIALSVAAAYVAASFNNIMDLLQLVFAFVNAPLFATFALGMFWKRSTGHGAFVGLISGTLAAAIHHGLTLPQGAVAGVKGGYFGLVTVYPSELAQTFWTAIFAWSTCFVVTIIVSLLTRPRADDQLKGLVYSLTEKPKEGGIAWYKRPLIMAVVVLILTVVLNLIFS
jgi:SSS family solute:Na+ symporter